MIVENVDSLKIHKLTQEQYDAALSAGTLDDNALYLTPNSSDNIIANIDLQELRKEMGLGDTLGALPVENMAITIVDDASEYADYGAEDGYVLSPKSVTSGGDAVGGVVVYGSGFSSSISIAAAWCDAPITYSSSSLSGMSIDESTGEVIIEKTGHYRISTKILATYRLKCTSTSSTTYGRGSVYISPSNQSKTQINSSLTMATLSKSTTLTSVSGESDRVAVDYFFVAGTTLTFSCMAGNNVASSGYGYLDSIGLEVDIARISSDLYNNNSAGGIIHVSDTLSSNLSVTSLYTDTDIPVGVSSSYLNGMTEDKNVNGIIIDESGYYQIKCWPSGSFYAKSHYDGYNVYPVSAYCKTTISSSVGNKLDVWTSETCSTTSSSYSTYETVDSTPEPQYCFLPSGTVLTFNMCAVAHYSSTSYTYSLDCQVAGASSIIEIAKVNPTIELITTETETTS